MPARAWVVSCSLLLLTASALATIALAQGGAGPTVSPDDPPRGDVRIVVFGDFNGPYGALAYPPPVARAMHAILAVWRPDLVLMPGDLVAGQDRRLPDERFAQMWAVFDREVAAPLRAAGIPYAATMGNHDASSLRDTSGAFAFARERDAAAAYWRGTIDGLAVDAVDAEAFPFRYAFRAGPLFVAIVDASSATVDAATRTWLEDVLSSPEARGASLRLAMGHLPLYPLTVGRDRPGEFLAEGDDLRLLLERLDVDTYVSGHQAAYYPGRAGGLELLFAGGVGGRRILGTDAPAPSAVTVVDVDLEGLRVRYASFDPATGRRLPGSTLPASVDAHGTTIHRSERGLP